MVDLKPGGATAVLDFLSKLATLAFAVIGSLALIILNDFRDDMAALERWQQQDSIKTAQLVTKVDTLKADMETLKRDVQNGYYPADAARDHAIINRRLEDHIALGSARDNELSAEQKRLEKRVRTLEIHIGKLAVGSRN